MTELAYLALIWGGVYLCIFFAEKTHLTPVLYFLAFGAITVNMGILPEETTPFLEVFAEIGIIVIMFALGFEENSSDFITSIKRSWGIAFFGALVPFMIAFYLTLTFWDDRNVALICGLAMTATAVSLTMVSLKGEGLHRTHAATGIMTSAVLDDIASLALLAIIIPLASGSGELSIAGVALAVVKAVSFFVAVSLIGMFVFPHDIRHSFLRRIPLLNRIGLKHLLMVNRGEQTTLALLFTALLISLMAYWFGFHPAIGAYMAGLIIREEYFQFHDYPEKNYFDGAKKVIDDVAFSWIGPVFFVVLGSKLIFDLEVFLSVMVQTAMLAGALFVGQIVSAGLAARYTGNFSAHESQHSG